LAATTNGLLVQTADLRYQVDTAMTVTLGFHSRIPAPLLLVQATQQQVDLMMQRFVCVFLRILAYRTFALMNCTLFHRYPFLALSVSAASIGYHSYDCHPGNPPIPGCYLWMNPK
jgi:hypothetical protein